ncbi:hypothetical protein AB3Z07_14650 [Metabacillus halosaccharovorans]|uniref:hypothetical protein n=1 Tax=Metabacillus halosaccharovorans TaxID=930124 RepID=UPI00203DA91F|nr:hypothetical protein [Metabacillus halosaccharovorans]MCM3442180.1 hypothetical protein [Metabacillus halosaccharovorans]
MNISIFLLIIFILSFLILFWFTHHENKKEEKKDGLLTLLVVAGTFSVIITLVFALFLFLIMGSTSVIDIMFSLELTTNQLLVIGISFLIYWFTIDNILGKFFEYLLGENIYALLALAISRLVSFYMIGTLIKLNEDMNMTISIGVSIILLSIEVLYFLRKKAMIEE